jgi:hypothetical protein
MIKISAGGATVLVPGTMQASADEAVPDRLYQWVSGTVLSACDETEMANLADGNMLTQWFHPVDERHWAIFDLGERLYVEKMRVYKNLATPPYSLTNIAVWVGHSLANLGPMDVASITTTRYGNAWVECTSEINASGRYVKIEFVSFHESHWVATGEIQFYV